MNPQNALRIQEVDVGQNLVDASDHVPNLFLNCCVQDLLRRSETSILYAASNVGKTALVCYIGACVIAGTPVFGKQTTKGLVVHVAAEAPTSVLDRMQAYDLKSPDLGKYIVRTKAVDLSSDAEAGLFIQELNMLSERCGLPVVLVVFDTFVRSIGASDENSSSAMTIAASNAERIARAVDAHVMLIHHSGKNAERGARGSSALTAAFDTEICLKQLEDHSVMVNIDKQRDLEKSDPLFFKTVGHVLGKDEYGRDRTVVKAVEVSRPTPVVTTKSPGAAETRRQAVEIALSIRAMFPALASAEFTTKDIVDILPHQSLVGVSQENRSNVVNRALTAIASARNPIIRGRRGKWTHCASPSVTGRDAP